MSRPTNSEINLLRSQPHRTNLYLSIYSPNTVLSAQVNDADIAKGDRVITYDGSSGDWTDVRRGMTLYVGTSAGGKDKGKLYVKSATSTTITVGENSHVNWADDDHLTITDFFQIWPLYPRYTQDEENITVYKDYDVAYTDQNEILGSFICMGPHHAGFLENGSHDVYFSASGTHHVGDDTLTYHWLFPNATVTGSNAHTPGNITYNTAGHYTASLTVSGTSTGAIDTSYRHISIYDRPENGSSIPKQSWNLSVLAGDRNSGGYTAKIDIKEDVSDIDDGALVVIFADDWYGTTQQSLGGNALNRSKIFYVGYILDGTIDFDYRTSTVSFEVGSPTEVMKLVEAFSVSVEDSVNPINDATNTDKGGDPWFYLVGLSMETALYHYLRWHSTVNLCADVEYISTDFLLQFFDADRASLYDAVNNLMESAVAGRGVCDRQGKLFFEINSEAIPDALTDIELGISLTKADWIGIPNITERTSGEVSYLELGGIRWDGAAQNTYAPMLIAAPGEVPAYRGGNQRLSGFTLTSLEQAKALAGNMYAHRNSRFPALSLDITGNYRNFDLAPLEAIQVSLASADTFRGLVWNNKPFTVNHVDWTYNPKQHFLRPGIVLSEVTEGFDADDLEIPAIPPEEGFEQPPIITPPLPDLPGVTPPTYPPIVPPVWPPYWPDEWPDTWPLPPIGTILMVPAIGGNFNNTTALSFGGHTSTTSIGGIEFENANPNDAQYSQAKGIFIVPSWATGATLYTIWNNTDSSATYESYATVYNASDGDLLVAIDGYITEAIPDPPGQDLGIGSAFILDGTFPGTDLIVYIYARGLTSSGSGGISMYGWYVVFT